MDAAHGRRSTTRRTSACCSRAGYRADGSPALPGAVPPARRELRATARGRGFGDADAITARAPVIVVMPDGGGRTAGTRTGISATGRPIRGGRPTTWASSSRGSTPPTARSPRQRGRAVAGLSMGRYGALSYAARHPTTFTAAASFSGALEIGSEAAWGPRSEQRGAVALAPAYFDRLAAGSASRSVELRTGNGKPGPLDRRRHAAHLRAPASSRAYLYTSNVRLHDRLRHPRRFRRSLGRLRAGHARTGPTGGATCARRCPTSCGCWRGSDHGAATRTRKQRETPWEGSARGFRVLRNIGSAKQESAPP